MGSTFNFAARMLLYFTEHDEICREKKIRKMVDSKVTDLDWFHASRKLAKTTSLKELETLRAFWAFCTARDLCSRNIAALIKGPKIEDQNDVVPYARKSRSGRLTGVQSPHRALPMITDRIQEGREH